MLMKANLFTQTCVLVCVWCDLGPEIERYNKKPDWDWTLVPLVTRPVPVSAAALPCPLPVHTLGCITHSLATISIFARILSRFYTVWDTTINDTFSLDNPESNNEEISRWKGYFLGSCILWISSNIATLDLRLENIYVYLHHDVSRQQTGCGWLQQYRGQI